MSLRCDADECVSSGRGQGCGVVAVVMVVGLNEGVLSTRYTTNEYRACPSVVMPMDAVLMDETEVVEL